MRSTLQNLTRNDINTKMAGGIAETLCKLEMSFKRQKGEY